MSESLKSWRLDAGLFSLVAGDVHYVATGPKWIEELFRYRTDSTESINAVGSESGTLVSTLREGLRKALVDDRTRRPRVDKELPKRTSNGTEGR